MDLLPFHPAHKVYDPFMEALETLLVDMDSAYDKAAASYGFHCSGCEDNCCRSSFHHHTLLECIYLYKGLTTLSVDSQECLLTRARFASLKGQGKKTLCPANVDERCHIYPYRPMICRLHGIPYVFVGANGTVQNGTGCHVCEQRKGIHEQKRLDRTPIYRQMALLEKDLRQQLSFNGRIHLTVAQMILDCHTYINNPPRIDSPAGAISIQKRQ